MDNKRMAGIIVLLVLFIFVVAGLMAVSSHLPFLGKALALVFALILVIGVVLLFAYATKRGKK